MGTENSEIIQFQWKICSWAMTSALVISFLFLFFNEKAIAKGLLLGTVFSIINFIILGKFIPLTIRRSRTKAGFLGLISILIRLIILAVPMIIAIKSASFEFIAVVAGIFSVQMVTFLQYVVIKPIQDGKRSI
jgi:hypothetical protein